MDEIETMAVVMAVDFKADTKVVVKETPIKDTADEEMVAADSKVAGKMDVVIMAKAVEAMVVAANIIQARRNRTTHAQIETVRSKPHINGKIVQITDLALATKETHT